MTFATLTLVGIAGIFGPLLAVSVRWRVPIVVGELTAGVIFGRTGTSWLHADQPAFAFLGQVGFVLVMFVAGTHVPVRDQRLRVALGAGAARAVAVGVLSAGLGVALAAAFGTGHGAMYAVVLACSSAALVVPIVDSLGLTGDATLQMLAQVAIADTACIVALPLAIDPKHAVRAAGGALAVSACAALLFVVLGHFERKGERHRLHKLSEERNFALELRISLALAFGLAAVAVRTHVSVMLAGFGFGLAIAGIGEPRRLARQLFAITEGFLGPLFFVWLGASLNLRDLGRHPSYIGLGVCLGLGATAVHGVLALTKQPLPLAVLAGAQLGVPVAAATVGSDLHLLHPGEAPALILGALVTVLAATVAGSLSARTTKTAT